MVGYSSSGGVFTDIKKLPKIPEEDLDDDKVPSVYKVCLFDDEDNLDLTYIANPEYREKVKQIVHDYKVEKV